MEKFTQNDRGQGGLAKDYISVTRQGVQIKGHNVVQLWMFKYKSQTNNFKGIKNSSFNKMIQQSGRKLPQL